MVFFNNQTNFLYNASLLKYTIGMTKDVPISLFIHRRQTIFASIFTIIGSIL